MESGIFLLSIILIVVGIYFIFTCSFRIDEIKAKYDYKSLTKNEKLKYDKYINILWHVSLIMFLIGAGILIYMS